MSLVEDIFDFISSNIPLIIGLFVVAGGIYACSASGIMDDTYIKQAGTVQGHWPKTDVFDNVLYVVKNEHRKFVLGDPIQGLSKGDSLYFYKDALKEALLICAERDGDRCAIVKNRR